MTMTVEEGEEIVKIANKAVNFVRLIIVIRLTQWSGRLELWFKMVN